MQLVWFLIIISGSDMSSRIGLNSVAVQQISQQQCERNRDYVATISSTIKVYCITGGK